MNARKFSRGTRRPRTHRVGPRPRTSGGGGGGGGRTRGPGGCDFTALLIPYYLIRYYVPAADVPPRAGLTGTGRSAPLEAGCSARPGSARDYDSPTVNGEPGRPTNVSRDSRGGGETP
jgi:hypothetical protein